MARRSLRAGEPHPAPDEVGSYPQAPHRYLWDAPPDVDGSPQAMPLGAFWKAAPYQPGEVVFTCYGTGWRLAYVAAVYNDYDAYGDRRHKYRVHLANKDGKRFALNWIWIFPGQIQRGYARAGKAPDIPEDAR